MIAKFGNAAPLHDVDPDSTDEHTTDIEFPDGLSIEEAFITVTDPSGVWTAQSGAAPTWVACSDPDLEAQFCAHYSCPAQSVPGVNA